jgi:hypothetical protein
VIIIIVVNAGKILTGNPEEKRPLGDLDVDGTTILKVILKNQDVRM